MKQFFKDKKWAPYIGLPLLVATLFFCKMGSYEPFSMLLSLLLLVFGYVAAVMDLREKRVPNKLVLAMLIAWILIMVPQLFLKTESAVTQLWHSAAGFLISSLLFLLVYFISRKGLGGGDVKLMGVAGLYLGWEGVLPTIFIGSVLAALTGGILVLAKKITMKDSIPLVPFLYVGMLLAIFF